MIHTYTRSQLFEQHAYEPPPTTLYTSHIVHTFFGKGFAFLEHKHKASRACYFDSLHHIPALGSPSSHHTQELMIHGEGVL